MKLDRRGGCIHRDRLLNSDSIGKAEQS
jgi:hypothetical protein